MTRPTSTGRPSLAPRGSARRRAGAIALVLAALSGPARADVDQVLARFERAVRFQLANGLTVLVYEDNRAPLVAVQVAYEVGHRADPPGRAGLAHVFEHLMFEGSAHVPGGHKDWGRRLHPVGMNATTFAERTLYFETVPVANLEAALWLESDRMGFLESALSEASLGRAREAVKRERAQKVDDRAYGDSRDQLLALLFPPPHPDGRPPNGSDAELDAISLDDVRRFGRAWYSPGNAVLTLVGDVGPAMVRPLVERYFGSLPSGPPPPLDLSAPPLAEEHRARVSDRFAAVPLLAMAWRTPPYLTAADAAGDLVAHLLVGGRGSRLVRRLEQELGLAHGCSARQVSRRGVSTFQLSCSLQPGVQHEQLLAAVDAELAQLAAQGPSADEIQAALASCELHLVSGFEGLQGLARTALILSQYQVAAGDPAGVRRDLARYRAVPAEGLRRFVAEHLDPRRRAVLLVDAVGARAPSAGSIDEEVQP